MNKSCIINCNLWLIYNYFTLNYTTLNYSIFIKKKYLKLILVTRHAMNICIKYKHRISYFIEF